MTKSQIQLAWRKIIRETRKRTILGEKLKEKEISQFGDFLLLAEVFLSKVEAGERSTFNSIIYRKTMNFYCRQMKQYGC